MARLIDKGRQLDELVGEIYDAALSRVPWLEVGERLKGAIGATTASVFVKNHDGTVDSLVRMATPQAVEAYIREFAAHDLWHHESVKRGIRGRAARGSEAVPDAVFERSYYYNEFSRLHGNNAFYCCGIVDDLETGAGVVALHRTRRDGDFSDDAVRALDRLKPHLYRALDIGRRLRLATAPQSDTWSPAEAVLPWGLIEVSSELRVRRTNALAERVLGAGDGLGTAGGRLVAEATAPDRRLRDLLQRAIRTSSGGSGGAGGYVSIPRPSGRLPYTVLVTPVGRDRVALTAASTAAMVFVADPELVPAADGEALRDLFGLTPAEARVVAGIAAGESLRQIAGATGTGYQTVRTLLARAMPKIGVSSQTGVVRQLALLPVARR